MDEKIRPVEQYFLLCYSKRSSWDLTQAIALVIQWLYNAGLVDIDKKEKTLTATAACDPNWPGLKTYEYLVLKAISTSYSTGLVKAVENYNFAKDLARMGYMVKPRFNLFGNPWSPIYSLTLKGRTEISDIKYTNPVSFFRITSEIIVYVDISMKIYDAKMLSYRTLRKN